MSGRRYRLFSHLLTGLYSPAASVKNSLNYKGEVATTTGHKHVSSESQVMAVESITVHRDNKKTKWMSPACALKAQSMPQ